VDVLLLSLRGVNKVMFIKITSEQVNSFKHLYQLLRRLRVLGVMKTVTERVPLTEMGKPIRYTLRFAGYDPDKSKLTPEEAIEEYFKSSKELQDAIDLCTRQSE
jgi:hypothetical protein